jgi:hypothetical protein
MQNNIKYHGIIENENEEKVNTNVENEPLEKLILKRIAQYSC